MLITEDYRKQQEILHSGGLYGTMGEAYAPIIANVINKLEVTHLLDYGCGSNLSLIKGLDLLQKIKHKFKYQAYDPCVERFSYPPVPAELVVCVDVLEHIEEDCIENVLDHLQSLTEAVGFFSVDTGPAEKVLSDGRNAHILQRPIEWWLQQVIKRFDLQTFQVTWQSPSDREHTKFFVIVYARPALIESTNGSKIHG